MYMYSEKNSISVNIKTHVQTILTYMKHTDSIGLVFYTQTVNIMTFNFFVYVNIYPSHYIHVTIIITLYYWFM